MALADLMRKGFLTSATATPATVATHRQENRLSVATVATVAVTKPLHRKNEIDPAYLALFRFDLLQADIDSGHSADELHRVNNMTWKLMTADGMTFEQAIKRAAETVAHSEVEDCEAAYTDVRARWVSLL